jgi:hypothetical protein
MKLPEATKKYKTGDTTIYQFTGENKETDIVIINKFKSGYEVEVNKHKLFKRTDGLKNMTEVQNWLDKI